MARLATDSRQLEQIVPDALLKLIGLPDRADNLIRTLSEQYTCEEVAESALIHEQGSPHLIWEMCGSLYLSSGRLNEAIAVYESLYDYLLLFQANTGVRA